jgi:hypothetical protein
VKIAILADITAVRGMLHSTPLGYASWPTATGNAGARSIVVAGARECQGEKQCRGRSPLSQQSGSCVIHFRRHTALPFTASDEAALLVGVPHRRVTR